MSRKKVIPENPSPICSFCGHECKNWKGRQTHEKQYCKVNPDSWKYEPQDVPPPEPEVASPPTSEAPPAEVIEAEAIIEAQIEEPPPPPVPEPEPEPTPEPKPETPPPPVQEPTPEPKPEGKETDWTKIGAIILVIVAIIFIIVGIYLLWKRKQDKTQKETELKAKRQTQAPQNAAPEYGPGEYPDV